MGIEQIFPIVRRLAGAIIDGRLEAKQIKSMSDEELAAFDDELFTALEAKQAESERLGHEGDEDDEK